MKKLSGLFLTTALIMGCGSKETPKTGTPTATPPKPDSSKPAEVTKPAVGTMTGTTAIVVPPEVKPEVKPPVLGTGTGTSK